MNPAEITASITAVANLLAQRLSNKELAYWGLVLSQLGETMGSLATLAELCEPDTGQIASRVGTGEQANTVIFPQERPGRSGWTG